jgi:bisphosphoglycerate-dependent phosphoglycerate mutase
MTSPNPPKITYQQLMNAIKETTSQIEINNVRYNDVQAKLNRDSTSLSRRAELVTKEASLDAEIKHLQSDLKILITAHDNAIAKLKEEHNGVR